MSKTQPVSLLEVGDEYVQATWRHPDSSTEIIGIYRFNPATEAWQMDQPLRGPWSVVQGGEVVDNPNIAVEAFRDTSYHAMGLFRRLQTDGVSGAKAAWSAEGGNVYDL